MAPEQSVAPCDAGSTDVSDHRASEHREHDDSTGSRIAVASKALAAHDFDRAFVEALGWEACRQRYRLKIGSGPVEAIAIARHAEFQAVLAPASEGEVRDRDRLRALHERLCERCAHYVLIHYAESPAVQVWQWTTVLPGGVRFRHLEQPPEFGEASALRMRALGRLVSSESHPSVREDFRQRVRAAMLPGEESPLFPRLAADPESDHLAIALQRGDVNALGPFVECHLPLTRSWEGVLRRWYDIDRDRAEESIVVAMLSAARRFYPGRGTPFSMQVAEELDARMRGLSFDWILDAPQPLPRFWSCCRLMSQLVRLTRQSGREQADRDFHQALQAARIDRADWAAFSASRPLEFLRQLDRFAVQPPPAAPPAEASSVKDPVNGGPIGQLLRQAAAHLSAQEVEVLQRRYGFKGRRMTLLEIGTQLGVTGERVRQIQARVEDRLEHLGFDVSLLPRSTRGRWRTRDAAPPSG